MEDLKDGVYIKDNWACLFNCMSFIDSSLSAEEYYEKYMQTHPAKDPARNGGVPVELNKDALEKCGFTVETATSYPSPSEGICIIVYHTEGQMGHAVIWQNVKEDVEGEKFYIVVDPSQYVNYPNDGDKYTYAVNPKDVAQVWKITK